MNQRDSASTDSSFTHDFFISYTGDDRAWAEWIGWVVEEAGYKVKIQEWDFRAGQNFPIQMHEAAKCCERTLAVISPNYFAARYTDSEWAAAFAIDPRGLGGKLVPVKVAKFQPDGLFAALAYIDLVGLNEDAARNCLLQKLEKGRAKPKSKPGYPGTASQASTTTSQKPQFPGMLPDIWNVPHRRNLNFTGRKELLESLRTSLTSAQAAAVTQAISGLGGVGKTQLALEYTYRWAVDAPDYKIVWWIRAEESAKLASDYASLAGALDLQEKDAKEQPIVIEAVRAWLEHNSGWLLVFDNVPHPGNVRAFLPRGRTGHVIITSHDPNWSGVATKLPVEMMTPEEAVKFLEKRTGESDPQTAAILAQELGYLPLALEQAGAYIETTGGGLSTYLSLVKRDLAAVMERGRPSTDYGGTVATTWEISFRRVEMESKAAADLLRLVAFLAPEDIPRVILLKVKGLLSIRTCHFPEIPFWLDEALATLRRFGLMEVRPTAVSVHRLVQAIVLSRMDPKERRTWAEAAALVLIDAWPQTSRALSDSPTTAQLRPHASAVVDHCVSYGAPRGIIDALVDKSELYLLGGIALRHRRTAERFQPQRVRRHYSRGVEYYRGTSRQEMDWAEAEFRAALEGDPKFALAYAGLADVAIFRYMSYFDRSAATLSKAEMLCQQALELDPERPETHRSLGRIHMMRRAFVQAKECFARAIALDPRHMGAYMSLAWCCVEAHDLGEAERVAAVARTLGKDDIEVRLLLCRIYYYKREYQHSIPSAMEALLVDGKSGRAYYELAMAQRALGLFSESRRSFQQSLAFQGDPNVHLDLGVLDLLEGDFAAAAASFAAAVVDETFAFLAHYYLGFTHQLMGHTTMSTAEFERSAGLSDQLAEQDPGDPYIRVVGAMAAGALGSEDRARTLVAIARELDPRDGLVAFYGACTLSWVPPRTDAIALLEIARTLPRSPSRTEIELDPHFLRPS